MIIKNGMAIIGSNEEPHGKCAYCGQEAELRPYGKNGAKICFPCGMKPENKKETERQFLRLAKQAKPLNPKHN